MKKMYALVPGAFRLQSILLKKNVIFPKLLAFFLSFVLISGVSSKLYADVTITSSPVVAANINQGTNNNIVYIAQVSATTAATVNNIQFTLGGTHDGNDLETVLVYFNGTSPVFAGSSFLGSAVATFAGPHAYSINVSRTMAAGSTGYFIIVTNINNGATDNNTIKVNGATSPMVFGFTAAQTVTNNQTDAAGTQTIQASDVAITSTAVAAADINQNTNNNIVYIGQMTVATEPVVVNNIQFTLGGTHDGNDLETVLVYFNSTAPVFTGSSFLGSAVATFAAPHSYSINISRSMAVGSTGYFIIVTNINPGATDNNTIKVNGATNPLTFGFTTTPNVTNTQTDAAGIQTIQAGDITITSTAVAASDINQGTNNNIVYIGQMTAATEPVVVNNIQFTLGGTHDGNDLETVLVYFNSTAPVFTGSSFLGSAVATFAAPHSYSINISRSMAVGSTGYFIIVTNVNNSATDNNTIKVNGATNPLTFGFTTTPNVSNTQTDAAGIQTIQAGDITITSTAVAASDINQGTNNNIVYIGQMTAATEPVVVNNIQFALGGTHDGNDLETVLVYFNSTAPVFTGSSFLGSAVATFAAPHSYSINISRSMAVGSTGYFIIVTNINPGATDNNTIKVNGATNPLTFGFTTGPNITNTQTDAAGTQTIQAGDISLTSSPVPAADLNQGSNNNILYIMQMSAATEPVTVNNIQFTLGGTYDGNDLETVLVYFNGTSPVFAGSSFLGSAVATFAAPHLYSINISRNMPVGSTGYFIIVTNVNNSATDNNTIKINGATNPLSFGFTTSPNVANTQTDAAGIQTIQASDITLATSPVATSNFAPGSNNNIVYTTQMSAATEPVTVNNIQFTLGGTHDVNDLETVLVYFNAASPVFAGSSFLGSAVATFAAPHAYSINISRNMAVGSTGYFIILVNVDPAATIGNTVIINGAVNPVTFGFTTSPNITNSQVDNGGLHTLPVNFINVSANSKAAGVQIEWKVGAELNISKYIVERSNDGRSFSAIGETSARGGGAGVITYNLLDAAPLTGNGFYRIRALNTNGRVEYSSIVRINTGKGNAGISLYPNPLIKNGLLNLQLQNLTKDTYTIKVFNHLGQQVVSRSVEHAGGTSVQTIILPKVAAGMYTLEVRSQHTQFTKTLVVE
ncbi:MAG: T9SS type A sorting domain-containing protein [Ferruginibacter sp.]